MDRYKIKPDQKINLDDWDPNETRAYDGDKKEGEDRLDELTARLEELQELLYAENKHKLLVVLQAMDTGGKDGTIRHVFEGVNPQGVRVAGFKVPTPEEMAHDYLWRMHKQTPGRRRDRDLQPLALRGRAGRAGPQPGAGRGLVAAL